MNHFRNVVQGNADYFKGVSYDDLLDYRDPDSFDLLSRAVIEQKLNCVQVIYRKCPELLYCENPRERWNALHHAAARDGLEIIKFLIAADAESQGRGATKRLTRMLDADGNSDLMHSVMNNRGAVAAELLLSADPDFNHPPNNTNQTPLKYCMSHSNMQDIFKLILERAPNQSKTPMGPMGWTILHHAASSGDLSAIKDILRFCPDCSEVVDNKGRNFLHIATQSKQEEVVKFCIVDIAPNVLNGQDNDGNTPLTIAASTRNGPITLCLLKDPKVDIKLAAVARHLHWAVRESRFHILKLMSKADPNFFNEIEIDLFRESKDGDGRSILSRVVQENDFDLCQMICTKHPSLLYHQSAYGKTALHHAAWRGAVEMVKLLITRCLEMNAHDPIAKLLIIMDDGGDTALHLAVSNHEHEVVKLLIEAGPDVEYSTNKSGETPLSIAIREAQSHENNRFDTGKIRKLLLKTQPSLIEARNGESGWTLLHLVASQDDLSTILDIIDLCPNYLDLIDNNGMNFLHVAAKSRSIQVVKHVLGGKILECSLLNMQDYNGNTPLHLAALSGDVNLTLCFLYDSNVDKMTVNKNGQHVLHAVNFDYDKRKAGVHGVTGQVDQRDLKDQSDFDLVVGALIATVSFTAGITVPGGYISDGPNKGTAVLSKKLAFEAFVILNTFALLFSLYAVFSHYCTRRLIKTHDIIYQLKVATNCTLGAIYAMMAAFIAGSFAVLANSPQLAISVGVICSSFYIFSIRPIWKLVMQERDGSRRTRTGSTTRTSRQRISTP